MDFSGKRVLVTGAGKGIGRATAKMLAARGAEVVAISRSQADLDSLAEEIGARGIAVDLADAEATRRAALEALPADFLVNNAGTTALASFLDLPVEDFDMLYAVNARAPMIVAQEYARDRVKKGLPGAIVNVSSISSWIGFADHTAYCASKGAMDAMTRAMANELGRMGIRVNAVNPTVTLTPMAVKAWSDPAKSDPMMKRIPVGHFADPDEVAEVILFLLSDRASMINGITMPVDGGFMVN
ncbi:MAG: SDR family oxidoreductase [Bosea sp.]|uniref:NAD(P)-dependent dehydrogenase (Short-subunit alcohol dehydrogenase family) n=1 Tax=Kaistia geumhonensis TaxID=410839 RepID=A0ABU0M5B1_9HYPH|nr:SDR family oxidoreductase [Kaistia geumhonensis]MBN9432669.1 SDR family oxidoreductase [Bosea sp. (in: a-proteobacteria)]MCX5478660.1 SDR family oxidoreductase [Kaistia geumhonensis]MDQ0516122.1 NAD(P)-dependent dehydrogenase (short-subunit alcohol dehydrogenase family) [Kaistia geumhonensis]